MPSENEPKTADPTAKPRSGLFRHRLRPDWGIAVLAWERDGRRAYQFDDGRLRLFKEGYYSLFEPVADQGFAATALEDELLRVAGATTTAVGRAKLEAAYPFEDQLRIFRTLYPDGFAGTEWTESRRGLPGMKRLKRHRDAAIVDAQVRLSPDVLVALCDEERYAEVIAAVVDVLGNTNLVAGAALKRIAGMDADAVGPVARSLRDLFVGDKRYGTRFTRFVASVHAACGKRPSWRLATAVPALVLPQEHVCVRRTVFARQAATLAPDLRYTKGPRRKAYMNFLEVARRTRDRLLDEGLRPRDYIDVHDFVWVTLRPAAAKHLA